MSLTVTRRLLGCRLCAAFLLVAAGTCSRAEAVPTCSFSSSATLSFGAVVALASTGDVSTNTGTSFWVNCTSDVPSTPALYSATTRTLLSAGNALAFALSAAAPGGADVPTASPGMPLAITRNGTNQTVTLYGKITSNNFRSLPAGLYSRSVTLTIEY